VLRLRSAAGRWVIVGMVLGSAVTFVNASVVNVALPAIDEEFGAGVSGAQWVANAYLLTLSALVLLAGSIGDVVGRRRTFLAGLALLSAASLAAAVAPSLELLVLARLVQGAGAAAVVPTSLAIVDTAFPVTERSHAVGMWASGSAVATAAAPFVGGWLVESASWRWVFAVSLPLAAVAAWATVRHVPESPTEPGRRVDVAGGVAATVAVAGVVFALIQGPAHGWGGLVVPAGLIGILAGAIFFQVERRASHPLLPLRLFGIRQFTGTNAVTLVVYFALGGAFFLATLQLQTVVGYSATAAGLAWLPLSVAMIVGSPRAGALATRHGPRGLMAGGTLVVGVGMLAMTRIEAGSTYLTDVLPAVLVVGVGLALMVAPLTAAVLGSVSDPDVGIASAVNNATARTAGLLATATLPLLAGTGQDLGSTEFSEGYVRAMVISAALCFVGAVVSWATVSHGAVIHTPQQPSPVSGCAQISTAAVAQAGEPGATEA
jgi:EmrB/QacA subfamily drug resistance transporter